MWTWPSIITGTSASAVRMPEQPAAPNIPAAPSAFSARRRDGSTLESFMCLVLSLGLLLSFRHKPVELIRKALSIRVVERRRPAGALARAAQLVQVVAKRETLLDVLRGIKLTARIERVAALGNDVRGERNIRRDDQVAGRELPHDVAVG